jgi:hypothetical protein
MFGCYRVALICCRGDDRLLLGRTGLVSEVSVAAFRFHLLTPPRVRQVRDCPSFAGSGSSAGPVSDRITRSQSPHLVDHHRAESR